MINTFKHPKTCLTGGIRRPQIKVPKVCGTRKRLPRKKIRPKEAARSRCRSRSVPPTNLHLPEHNKSSSSHLEHPAGTDSSTACPQDFQEEALSPAGDSGDETLRKEDEKMGNTGGKALSLEETIADFDNALREHRQRRGVLLAASDALIADDPQIDGWKHDTDEYFKQNKENTAVSSWPEGGVKSWATVPPAREYLEGLPWNDEQTKCGNLRDEDELKMLLDQELGIAEPKECHNGTGETPTASHDVDLEGASSPRHRLLTEAPGRRLLQTMSENAPDRKLEANQGLTTGPELWPVGEVGECLTGERNNTAEVKPLQVEIIHSNGEAESELLEHTQKSNECNKMLWDRQPDSKGEDSSEGHETHRDGTKNAGKFSTALYDKAFGASVAIGVIPDQLG